MGFDFDGLSKEVIGAALEVHRALGPGFLESVYEQALRLELTARQIPFEAQKRIDIIYNGRSVGTHIMDLVVDDRLIVELKAVSALEEIHFSQTQSYLRATGIKVGLLMNFNSPKLVVKRVVRHFVPELGLGSCE